MFEWWVSSPKIDKLFSSQDSISEMTPQTSLMLTKFATRSRTSGKQCR